MIEEGAMFQNFIIVRHETKFDEKERSTLLEGKCHCFPHATLLKLLSAVLCTGGRLPFLSEEQSTEAAFHLCLQNCAAEPLAKTIEQSTSGFEILMSQI